MDAFRTWTPEDVQHELDALEASKSFRRAPGLVNLLRFLVETELSGEGARLKETTVGMAVYRRGADYDPKADGVVRVNANRLRHRLSEHYHDHPSKLKIVLQAGSYRPRFESAVRPESTPPPAKSAQETSTAPVPPLPQKWIAWAAAALLAAFLLMLALSLSLWKRHANAPRWTQAPLSGVAGMQQFPDFSPDNQRIAYAISENDALSSLYTQDLTGGPPLKLTTAARYETRPAWSPDGKSLAFLVRDADQSLHLFVRSIGSGAETEIYSRPTSGPWLCAMPRLSWTPDGAEIVTTAPPANPEPVTADPHSLACSVVAINLRSHATRQITHAPPGTLGDLEPAVSPDGRAIAFLRELSFETQDLLLVNIDGSGERRVLPGHNDLRGVAWMPDSKALLLFAHFAADPLRIVRLDLESGKMVQLQSEPAAIRSPAVSRDGHHIAFTEYRQKSQVLRLQDDALQRVFDDGVVRLNAVSSPDGNMLAYTSDRSGLNQVWISDSDGRNERKLTAAAGAGASRPAWFPDSNSVAFECRDEGLSNICIQGLHSGTSTVLVKNGADAIVPTLSADGARLYFVSNITGTYEAYRQRLHLSADGEITPTGKPQQLTTGGAPWIYESRSGATLYLCRADPSKDILAVPAGRFPIRMNSLDPSFVLQGGDPDHTFMDVTPDGAVIVDEQAGKYRLSFYRENSTTPVVREMPALLDGIDSINWDAKRNAVLISIRAVPMGELNLLTDK